MDHIVMNIKAMLLEVFCTDDIFNKLVKKYMGDEVIYNFIQNKTEKMKYWKRVMKNEFDK